MKGIKNVGNTCYMNSILQSLSYNKLFIECINKYIKHIEEKLLNTSDKYLFLELYKIIKELNTENEILSIIPSSFIKVLENIWKTPIQVQQDSADLLQLILDNIITYFGDDFNQIDIEYETEYMNKLYKMSNENMKLTFKKQYSEFNEIFYGQKLYVITCNECHNIEQNFEIFNILNLSLNEYDTLQECLDNYFDYFKADEYVCDNCKSDNVCHKYYLWKIPKTLTITFKRFDNNLNKINNLVKITDNLCLKKYIYNDIQINKYNDYSIYSIINHYGGYNGGHYISLINSNNRWICFDDNNINEISSNDVNSFNNYILFYNMN